MQTDIFILLTISLAFQLLHHPDLPTLSFSTILVCISERPSPRIYE